MALFEPCRTTVHINNECVIVQSFSSSKTDMGFKIDIDCIIPSSVSLANLNEKLMKELHNCRKANEKQIIAAVNSDSRIKSLEAELRKHKKFCEEVLCGYESTKIYQSTTELLAKGNIDQ
ncbi:hypothetical protein [Aliivibrio salmonicida]|uniref:hypothetical protein n=1 Tax=Aliivibrio salmonicida TaxID=40269 RepID=UPI003D14EB7F